MTTYNWHEEAGKQWDSQADYWSKNSENMWESGSRKTIIPFIKKHVPNGSSFLDIGCGDGQGSHLLYKEGYHVIGADLSVEMVEKANEKWGNQADNLTFVQADLTNLPFQNNSQTAVMAINSLEWTEVPAHALQEIKRIVSAEGYLCAGILGPTAAPRVNSYKRIYGEKVIMNTMMPWEFERMAGEIGWEVIASHGVTKRDVNESQVKDLPQELKQALSFMWVYMLKKKK